MRAQRRLAILDAIRRRGVATDADVATATGLSKKQVEPERRDLVREGLVEAVPAPEGSRYPIAGWRLTDVGDASAIGAEVMCVHADTFRSLAKEGA